jgi:hypothetical protein
MNILIKPNVFGSDAIYDHYDHTIKIGFLPIGHMETLMVIPKEEPHKLDWAIFIAQDEIGIMNEIISHEEIHGLIHELTDLNTCILYDYVAPGARLIFNERAL